MHNTQGRNGNPELWKLWKHGAQVLKVEQVLQDSENMVHKYSGGTVLNGTQRWSYGIEEKFKYTNRLKSNAWYTKLNEWKYI